MRHNLFALVMFATCLPFGAAGQPLIQSQEGIALQNEILQLQNQVQQLQANGGGGGGGSSLGDSSAPAPTTNSGTAPPDSSVVTNLLAQVGQLQSQIQQLNGEVDTLQQQVNTQHDQTEKEIGDLNFKVSGGAAATPGATTPQSTAPTPPPPAPVTPPPSATLTGTPKQIMYAGEAALLKGDYATAEAAARNILANANTSPQAYHAQFLLAQSLAGENKPQDAAIAYDDAYNRDKTGAYAPQSLLGLANSLADINQNEAACDTLSSLNSQFPTPPAGMADRIASASHRAHCS